MTETEKPASWPHTSPTATASGSAPVASVTWLAATATTVAVAPSGNREPPVGNDTSR
jgi:hypothetical protein